MVASSIKSHLVTRGLSCHHRMLAVQSPPLERMAVSPQTVFRQRFCKASECRSLFFICSHCDRGQRYCSEVCRQISRLQQQRAARRRYQQSPEGRLDHRDRQRAYRLSKATILRDPGEESVMDHGSPTVATSATMGRRVTGPRSLLHPKSWNLGKQLAPAGSIICRFCGRLGRFVDPFHEPM